MIDRRLAIIIVALSAAVALFAIVPKVSSFEATEADRRHEQAMISRAFLSDLPLDFMLIKSEGPCHTTSIGQGVPALIVLVRAMNERHATVSVQYEREWPLVPQRTGSAAGAVDSPGFPVISTGVEWPFRQRDTLLHLVTQARGAWPSARCIVLRAEQSIHFGDVYSIGRALQDTPDSQTLIFAETAQD